MDNKIIFAAYKEDMPDHILKIILKTKSKEIFEDNGVLASTLAGLSETETAIATLWFKTYQADAATELFIKAASMSYKTVLSAIKDGSVELINEQGKKNLLSYSDNKIKKMARSIMTKKKPSLSERMAITLLINLSTHITNDTSMVAILEGASRGGRTHHASDRQAFKNDYKVERGDDPATVKSRPAIIADLKEHYSHLANSTLDGWAKGIDKEDGFIRKGGRPKKG